MPKYRVYGVVTGTKFVGEYEADNAEAAKKMANGDAWVSLCHQCSEECEDPEIHKLIVETDD